MKRVLLVPNDVVGEKMAAPGIRHFHFARELARDGRFDVTLMVTNDPREVELDGVRAIGTRPRRHRQMRDLARSFDVIVAQGGLDFRSMVFLAGTDVRTIYDLYAPFFEMLTFQGALDGRSSEPRLRWEAYCLRHRILLLTGRAFIGANEEQRHALLGALAAVGRIALEDYRLDPTLGHLVRAVGLGVDVEPPRATTDDVRAALAPAREGDRLLIWPGNLWDWFDPDTLIRAMAKISAARDDVKLFCLGLRHPASGYGEMTTTDRAIGLAEELGVKDRTVFFDFGWIPYQERQNYLLAADIGVNVHSRHVETTFSYRTRLLDYLWAALPVVTTEGGALSDLVERNGLGRTVGFADVDGCARAILELCDDAEEYGRVRERVARFRQQLTWQRAVAPLAELIEAPQSPVDVGPALRGLALQYARARARLALRRDRRSS
ncbi:MAG: glycosyltransferase family 4 protein [Actinomycetota bacterium]|nr:glycosyltransferase family 4 protein [Actinomycetota bacterium]